MEPNLSMLTVDVVMNIAFAIPDAADILAFLEVLRPFDNLGPLEQLYQLGLTTSHADLWPILYIKSSVLGTPKCYLYEAVLKMYSNVTVENFSADQVVWLETHLNPTTELTWFTNDDGDKFKPRDNWYELRTTCLMHYSEEYSDFEWKSVLPRLRHLRSLE
ncbi:unnamed protein product, partial [Aphanomyces euteiches]